MTFQELLGKQILVLDGGHGTMIQSFNLSEQDFRGERFAQHPGTLKGNYDLLCITRPDVIQSIHRQYLEAGARVLTTDTLNANAISMTEYAMQPLVREMNLAAAGIARREADGFMRLHAGETAFVAGSIGPTGKTASMSQDVNDPAHRDVTYAALFEAYHEQAAALVDGGVDILLFETVFDTLNLKAGLDAATQLFGELGRTLPIMVSLTLSGKSGRTFSGQTIPAFLASIMHAPITTVGLNCSFGAADMLPHLRELAAIAPFPVSAYPNAGLPNALGQYDETPDSMEAHIRLFVEEGLVNIVGGCCGSTPAHIARFPALVRGVPPRKPAAPSTALRLSGMDHVEIKPGSNFTVIGERCNVAGSRRFLHLIKIKGYEEALTVAGRQADDGALILDVNMDDGMIDTAAELTRFLHLMASEPRIASLPVMIDSSNWDVICAALQCVQGKSVVNSISLKDGEAEFLRRARHIRRMGAAVVVMAFDEKGQADSFERRIEICQRAYTLLTAEAGFPPQDIIFDPNVLAVATGIAEHNSYGVDFIRAVEWIKQHLPHAKVSGGVSNLSFSFRGNRAVREAMHTVFLYHAIRAGLDMAIVNPSETTTCAALEASLRDLIEDVVLNRRPEALDALLERAQALSRVISSTALTVESRLRMPVHERLEQALITGSIDFLQPDIIEALQRGAKPMEVLEGPLMRGMSRVGELFGEGKMFLPQVVKTARTMKRAVTLLQPFIQAQKKKEGTRRAGRIVVATVKGDVHDIGKNIVSIVLSCNGYDVIDLGVMVPAEEIIAGVEREQPDILGLSGLITPSLDEMVHVVKEMQRAGHTIPIMIGGATTSRIHTALKIAPYYSGPVLYMSDASQNPPAAARVLSTLKREEYIREVNAEYSRLRRLSKEHAVPLLTLADARKHRPAFDWSACEPDRPAVTDVTQITIPVDEAIAYINWKFFFSTWRMHGRYAELAQMDDCMACRTKWLMAFPPEERLRAEEAFTLFHDATGILERLRTGGTEGVAALFGIFPAVSKGDDIILADQLLPMLRQQTVSEYDPVCRSLADYVIPAEYGRTDYVGAFAVNAGPACDPLRKQLEAEGDSYSALVLQTISDRLAEAATERLHELVRRRYWGYASAESLTVPELFSARYRGIRPAVGYPSLPDQRYIFNIDRLLGLGRIGISVTESGAMSPPASVAGFCFAHPDSRYFLIGHIDAEQLKDYSRRSRTTVRETRKFLVKNLL